jgi:hypothetical protein
MGMVGVPAFAAGRKLIPETLLATAGEVIQ